MAETIVDARRLGAFIRERERARLGAASAGLRRSARIGADIVRRAAPDATGDLKRSVDVEYENGEAFVVVNAPHALFVELGCRPHMPPVPPLIRWAQAIGAPDPRDAAWAVANKISRVGLRPTWFVRGSLSEMASVTGTQVRYSLTVD